MIVFSGLVNSSLFQTNHSDPQRCGWCKVKFYSKIRTGHTISTTSATHLLFAPVNIVLSKLTTPQIDHGENRLCKNYSRGQVDHLG